MTPIAIWLNACASARTSLMRSNNDARAPTTLVCWLAGFGSEKTIPTLHHSCERGIARVIGDKFCCTQSWRIRGLVLRRSRVPQP